MKVLACHDPASLHALLADLQPRSTPLLGAAMTGRRGRAFVRMHLVKVGGTVGGALVMRRWSIAGWTAHPLVLDASAAAPIGRLIDRSGATDLMGFSVDTEAVRPHVRRWVQASTVTAASVPPGFAWPAPPDCTRPARAADLPVLRDLAWDHAPHSIPTRWQMRARMRSAIDGHTVTVLAGDPARIVGYAARESHTPEYDFWAHLVIQPEFRGRGLAWSLVAAAADRTSTRGAGAITLVLPTNPMTIPPETALVDPFVFAWLTAPRRFKGEAKLRAMASRSLRRPGQE